MKNCDIIHRPAKVVAPRRTAFIGRDKNPGGMSDGIRPQRGAGLRCSRDCRTRDVPSGILKDSHFTFPEERIVTQRKEIPIACRKHERIGHGGIRRAIAIAQKSAHFISR